MMNIEQEIEVLKRQVNSLRTESKHHHEYIDVMVSPLRKRIWWWIGGFYFKKVGRWYSKETHFYKVWYFVAKIIKCT